MAVKRARVFSNVAGRYRPGYRVTHEPTQDGFDMRLFVQLVQTGIFDQNAKPQYFEVDTRTNMVDSVAPSLNGNRGAVEHTQWRLRWTDNDGERQCHADPPMRNQVRGPVQALEEIDLVGDG